MLLSDHQEDASFMTQYCTNQATDSALTEIPFLAFAWQDCGGLEYPDLYSFEDGSGRQTYLIQPVAGTADQFYLIAQSRLREGCPSYLSLADCSSSDFVVRYAGGDYGEHAWNPLAACRAQASLRKRFLAHIANGCFWKL